MQDSSPAIPNPLNNYMPAHAANVQPGSIADAGAGKAAFHEILTQQNLMTWGHHEKCFFLTKVVVAF